MNNPQKRNFTTPVIVGAVCFVAATAYVFFMFYFGKPKEPPKSAVSTVVHKTIRLGSLLTGVDYAPFFVLKSKHWLQAELGVQDNQIEFTMFQTPPAVNEAFASGRLDVVLEAEIPAIVGRAAGIEIRITGLEATLREGILVRSNTDIHTLRNLRGRRVAALSGTGMHYGLMKLLSNVGLDNRSVSLVNMTPPDAAAAFASGQVDGWAIWPPWPEQQALATTGRFLPGSEVAVQSVVTMRKAFIDEGPTAGMIMRAFERAKVWLNQNPEEGITLTARELKLSEEVVRLTWSKHDWAAQLTPAVSADIEAKAGFLLKEGMIQHGVSAGDIVQRITE